MKARLTVLAAAVAVSALFAGASPAGREPSCSDGLVSPSFGWATCDRRLFVTEDGRDWSDVTPPGLLWQVEDVLFLSHSRGWVAGNDCVRGKAYVYGTFDGGRTWRSSPVANVNCAAGSRLSLSFVDSRHGWYLQVFGNTFGMALAKTGDGGASWYGVAKELPIKGEISFRTRAEGWLGRNEFRDIQRLYVSRDGGRSWRRRVLPPPRSWSGARLFPDVPVFFGSRGILPVMLFRRGRSAVAFYATSDGGMSWQLRAVRRVRFTILKPRSPFVWYVPVSIASPEIWWMADGRARPFISATNDGGRNWRTLRGPNVPRARSWEVSGVSVRAAWLTTHSAKWIGTIFATEDGGRTWRHLRPH